MEVGFDHRKDGVSKAADAPNILFFKKVLLGFMESIFLNPEGKNFKLSQKKTSAPADVFLLPSKNPLLFGGGIQFLAQFHGNCGPVKLKPPGHGFDNAGEILVVKVYHLAI